MTAEKGQCVWVVLKQLPYSDCDAEVIGAYRNKASADRARLRYKRSKKYGGRPAKVIAAVLSGRPW